MNDTQKIAALREALASLLRQTADPVPTHPMYIDARRNAALVYQETASDYRPADTDDRSAYQRAIDEAEGELDGKATTSKRP